MPVETGSQESNRKRVCFCRLAFSDSCDEVGAIRRMLAPGDVSDEIECGTTCMEKWGDQCCECHEREK